MDKDLEKIPTISSKINAKEGDKIKISKKEKKKRYSQGNENNLVNSELANINSVLDDGNKNNDSKNYNNNKTSLD